MPRRISPWLIALIVILYALDQLTKWAIVLNFPYTWEHSSSSKIIPVIQGSEFMNFCLVRVHNTGVAFGTGHGTAWAPFVFLCIQIVALIWFYQLFRKGFFSTRALRVAWALITTGIIGNMTDRLLQGFFIPGAESKGFFTNLMSGYVVDFLDFSFPWIKTIYIPILDFSGSFPWLSISKLHYPYGYHWPSFNVADSCVCIAAALFIISSFFMKKEEEKPA